MTEADYGRVSSVDWGSLNDAYKDRDLFRPLKDHEREGTAYEYAIKPDKTNRCPFLVDNLCFIHKNYGGEFKPSICQLFPYSFNQTPTGIFVTVSFDSIAVMGNQGAPLTEQREMLEGKWQDYQRLYKGYKPDWSNIVLTTGVPLTWDEYLNHEKVLLSYISDHSISMEERLLKGSAYLIEQAQAKLKNASTASSTGSETSTSPIETSATFTQTPDTAPKTSAQASKQDYPGKLKHMDKHLLKALQQIYFPTKPLKRGEGDFSTFRFVYQLIFQGTRLAYPTRTFSFEELDKYPWDDKDQEIESLMYRFFYSRIFGKFYFGPSLANVSLIAGFHRLIVLYALLKMETKMAAINRKATLASVGDLMPVVWALERRMGESSLNGYATATLELLLFSHQRMRRILANC
jgi:Fe-S-cluster containining protein